MPRILEILDGDAVELIVCGCAPFAKKTVQNAGTAFFNKYERTGGSDDGSKDGSPSKSARKEDSSDEGDSPTKGPKKKKEKKERSAGWKIADCLKGEDLYALLDVDVGAGDDALKKAYRKICLVHHPDKAAGKSPEEMEKVNEHFVKLQEAYGVLSDMKKRRKYDSLGEFDDSVPSRLKDGQDFYEVFDPVFKRNAKWSENKPVPELGNADTPYDKVQKFYEFWFAFESWRDLDEAIIEECGDDCFQDTEDAESRDERRWMEKENARLRKKYLTAENKRVFGFVELAEKIDPRVRAEKDKQFADREEAKLAKEAAKLAKEEKAAEAEAAKEKEEERARVMAAVEKAKKQKENQAKKEARTKLRKVVKGLNLGLAEDFLQDFLLSMDENETTKLTDDLAKGAKGEAVFSAMKAKGVEPVILTVVEDDKSTTEGGPSEEEKPSEEEMARMEKERVKRQKDQERKRKADEAKMEIVRAEEAAVRAEEKKVRDAKKAVENEKKEREQQKNNKKQAEAQKREEEKVIRDAEKLVEKAKKEKEANAKRAEDQKLKQKAESQAENAEKALEVRTFEFERDRLARADAFDRAASLNDAIKDAAQAAVDNPVIASALASAAEWTYEDPEELLDLQLNCLGGFFVLGARPAEDSLALSSGLRSRVKKIRTRLQKGAASGEFVFQAPAGTVGNAEALEALTLFAKCEGPSPLVTPEAAAAADAAEEGPKKGKKAKAKAAPAGEENLDDLLAEFGVTATAGKKKSGKKK